MSIVTEAYKGNLSINHYTVTCSICLGLPSAIKNHREPPPNHQLALQLDVKHQHLLFCFDHNVNRNLPDHNVNRAKGGNVPDHNVNRGQRELFCQGGGRRETQQKHLFATRWVDIYAFVNGFRAEVRIVAKTYFGSNM